MFVEDLTTGSGFADLGPLDAQYDADGVGCPAEGSMPITFSPQPGHPYHLVATDSALAACDGTNDPTDGLCIKMGEEFVDDANGYTRTDIVDGRTIIGAQGVPSHVRTNPAPTSPPPAPGSRRERQ